jgi:methanogenic corrinoid protein MtbC1
MGQLATALSVLDKNAALAAVRSALDAGTDPLELVEDGRLGLESVGAQFDRGEVFLMELMRAARIFQSVVEVLNPRIIETHGAVQTHGLVVLGTVAGDIHDLGKNIVKILLECRGVRVIDLGVDVPAGRFVDAIREHRPQVVGMSALLTASVAEMNRNVEAFQAAGLTGGVKVIVGGGIVGEIERGRLKAHHATGDANEGVRKISSWIDGDG